VAEFSCSRPELFFSGDHFIERIIQLIEQTGEYILIDSFLVLEDEMGKIILEALKKKLRRESGCI